MKTIEFGREVVVQRRRLDQSLKVSDLIQVVHLEWGQWVQAEGGEARGVGKLPPLT